MRKLNNSLIQMPLNDFRLRLGLCVTCSVESGMEATSELVVFHYRRGFRGLSMEGTHVNCANSKLDTWLQIWEARMCRVQQGFVRSN